MPIHQPSLFASVAQREELERQTATFIDEATATIRSARAMVEAGNALAIPTLDAGRDTLFALLGRYQRFKHSAIFNPVIQRGITSSAIVARSLKAECVLMGESFANYHARWAYADLAAVWPAYRRDMLDMTGRLLEHLRTEREAINKLLALSMLYQKPETPVVHRPRPAASPGPVPIMSPGPSVAIAS